MENSITHVRMENAKVIDLYHEDDEPDFKQAWEDGIRGVIHKASEGTRLVDPKYKERRNRCMIETPDMLWGAYHFARPGDTAQQVTNFLGVVSSAIGFPTHPSHFSNETVLVLDHEDPAFSISSASRWLALVKQISGKTPWLYSGFLIREQMEHRHAPEFAQYPLWLAEYGPTAKIPLPWKTAVLHQYTDGHDGPEPRRIKGMPAGLDISAFAGTDDDLRKAWLA